MTSNLTEEEIKKMIFQLPVEQIIALMADIEERVENLTMMQLVVGCVRP
ncbi:hypothetical protein [Floridanema aerugineum]|uniref:Uncharacterized protein n=1 Tax=Floridaenema aerugineum BLCC-F46 TaxID=3153654 RepID=A0ABV4X1W7_9CYAN